MWLYVYDATNIRVQEVDATTGALGRVFTAASSAGTPAGGGLAYLRPSAWPTLIIPSSRLHDLTSGLPYQGALSAAVYALSIAVSADSTRVVTESGTVFSVRRSLLVESTIETEFLFSAGPVMGREGQACIGADGTVVYTASGGYYRFPGTSTLTHDTVQVLPELLTRTPSSVRGTGSSSAAWTATTTQPTSGSMTDRPAWNWRASARRAPLAIAPCSIAAWWPPPTALGWSRCRAARRARRRPRAALSVVAAAALKLSVVRLRPLQPLRVPRPGSADDAQKNNHAGVMSRLAFCNRRWRRHGTTHVLERHQGRRKAQGAGRTRRSATCSGVMKNPSLR